MIDLTDEEIQLIRYLIEDKVNKGEYEFGIELMYELQNKCDYYLNAV